MFDFLLWYGVFALSHLFTQINFSHREYLNTLKTEKNFFPSCAIIIPSYNENRESLTKCINSCINQKYPKPIKIILVDDGSRDKNAIKEINEEYPQIKVYSSKTNNGKRHAQKIGFDIIDKEVDIIVTVDSDTILDEEAILNLVQKFNDKTVGAVTGNVRVVKTKKFLSRLIDARYWTAFNQERSAQSLFGTVLCCCGVLSAYRSEIIRKVKDDYVSQMFLGKKCTYGDDRHLTNLVFKEGYKVKYERNSKALTDVPQTIKMWLKQQNRWNKSFYRELIYTVKMLLKDKVKLHPYVYYDLTIQALLPLLLILSLGFVVYRSIIYTPYYLLGYIAILVGIALLRGSYALLRTKDLNFLFFSIYAFLHIFLLIPNRIYAIVTIKETKWGTR